MANFPPNDINVYVLGDVLDAGLALDRRPRDPAALASAVDRLSA